MKRFALGAFLAWFAITVAWWVLAFAPLPVPPEWLERARTICFGTLPDGLPDTWGWMLLVLGPLSMLTFLVAVWGSELLDALGGLARRAAGWLVLGPVALTLVVGGLAVAARVAASDRVAAPFAETAQGALPADYPRTADPAPALPLTDQHGQPFELAQLAGRPAFLTFLYGHCPIVCPTLASTLRRASAGFDGSPPPTVVVTLDPWRDTPAALPGILETWQLGELPGVRALSGPVPDVMAAIEPYRVGFTRDERTGDIGHAALVVVLDAQGRIAYRFLNPSAAWLVEAARRLEQEPG